MKFTPFQKSINISIDSPLVIEVKEKDGAIWHVGLTALKNENGCLLKTMLGNFDVNLKVNSGEIVGYAELPKNESFKGIEFAQDHIGEKALFLYEHGGVVSGFLGVENGKLVNDTIFSDLEETPVGFLVL